MKLLKIVKKQVCHIRHEMSQKNKNKSKNVENIKNLKKTIITKYKNRKIKISKM